MYNGAPLEKMGERGGTVSRMKDVALLRRLLPSSAFPVSQEKRGLILIFIMLVSLLTFIGWALTS